MNYGRYEIENEEEAHLGKGAMGVVYRALDPRLNRDVAIKVLHRKLLHDDDAVQNFFKEAILNASLSHPNILTVLDVGEERDEVYIAMELLEGKPLSKIGRTLDSNEIISIGMQIAQALDFAHRKGIVHRDIKPANIMVHDDGRIKITDFGIAKGFVGDDSLQTQTGVIKGTPAYMSPEQARGDSKNVDGRSDLFSLGVILYELSVGKRPFGGDGRDFMTIFAEILNKTPLEPCKAKESVERELSAVIMKALQKDPAKRYQSGIEFVEALSVCRNHEGAVPKKATRLIIGTSAVVAALLLAGALFFLHGGNRNDPAPGNWVLTPPLASAPAAAPSAVREGRPAAASAPAPVAKPAPSPVVQLAPERNSAPAPAKDGSNSSVRPAASAKAAPPTNDQHKAARKEAGPAKGSGMKAEPQQRTTREIPVESEAAGRPESLPVASSPAAAAHFAFLNIASDPPGAQVHLNGSLKGMTPLKLRLNLGSYKVRLVRAGYRDATTSVTLDRMAEFPINEELKPE